MPEQASLRAAPPRPARGRPRTGPARRYRSLSNPEYAIVARHPNGYVGDRFVVYGVVTQFDTATGPDTFRASTAGARRERWDGYDVDAVLSGKEGLLAGVLRDDVFKAHVRVLGSLDYQTQIGGQTRAPWMLVEAIEVIG